jgi:6-phosphogluconolactonase
MKFNTITRCAIAAGMSLALGLGFSACSRDYTAAYVYSVSNITGQVSGFGVDYQSGVLTQLSGSPFPSSVLTNPTTLVAAPNGKTIYVVGGTQNAEVQGYSVGSDGKLYGGTGLTANITGFYPTAAAIDSTGTFLYVAYTYQNGFGPVSVGPGGITVFPINADGTLGTASNINLAINPVGIAVSVPTCTATPVIPTNTACAAGGTPNVFVYVTGGVDVVSGGVTTVTNTQIDGFAQNTTTGSLTPVAGNVAAGVAPSAIAIDPTSRYLYVTDKYQNVVYGYQIASQNTGALIPLVSSPYATGQFPVSITFEPRGKYVYVANYNSASVSSYSFNTSNGSLGSSAGGGFTAAAGTTCVTVEPALGIYLYASDYLTAEISGGQLSPNTGQLSGVVNTPFPTSAQPVCVVSVANGPHASQFVQQ